jgi:predicted SAM-dependent methyltransferase
MKLQLGCGGNILDGWSNHDRDVDLEKLPLPFPDNSAEMVFLEHCFEHFDTAHGLKLLDELYRILKPSGRLRLCVPIVAGNKSLTKDAKRDLVLNYGHRAAYSTELLYEMLDLAGFDQIVFTDRKEIDRHWTIIGAERDAAQTARVEAVKS